MGHTSFRQNQPILRRSCQKAMRAPKKATVARAKAEALQQNARQTPGISIFGGVYISNRMFVVKITFVNAASV
jgi:hypothetical protein